MRRIDLLDGPVPHEDERGEEIKLRYRCPIRSSRMSRNGKAPVRKGDRVILRDSDGNLFSISTRMTGDTTLPEEQ